MSLIQLKDVYKIYAEGQENQVNALDGVTLSIDQGEFVAIIGTSGSGKSTLLHIIGGVDVPTSGAVYLDGQDVYAQNNEALAIFRRRQVGLIYQFHNLIPTLKDAVPGDLSLVFPHRIMVDIAEMIEALDKVTPGIASDETLLYGVEVKFYSNKVVVDKDFETSIRGLRAIGDGAGVTRGLQQASANGISVARSILRSMGSKG